jgi:alcohol dehydrogenase class IV
MMRKMICKTRKDLNRNNKIKKVKKLKKTMKKMMKETMKDSKMNMNPRKKTVNIVLNKAQK